MGDRLAPDNGHGPLGGTPDFRRVARVPRLDERGGRVSVVPDTLHVERLALSPEQQAWVEKAWALIDEARLREIIEGMVSIPSPTGEEGPLAVHLADLLRDAGLRATYQPIDDRQGNADRAPRWERRRRRSSCCTPRSTPSRPATPTRTARGSAPSCGRTCAPRRRPGARGSSGSVRRTRRVMERASWPPPKRSPASGYRCTAP